MLFEMLNRVVDVLREDDELLTIRRQFENRLVAYVALLFRGLGDIFDQK
jgi:hypothetical protein